MDGENNGKPYFLDDWGGSTHIIYTKICEEIQTVTATNHRPPTETFAVGTCDVVEQHLNLELSRGGDPRVVANLGWGFWQVKLQSWKTCFGVQAVLVFRVRFLFWSSLSDLLKKGFWMILRMSRIEVRERVPERMVSVGFLYRATSFGLWEQSFHKKRMQQQLLASC